MKNIFYRINVMLLAAVVLIMSVTPAFAAEGDVNDASSDAGYAVELLRALNIIEPDDSDEMGKKMTRAEFAVLLCRFIGMSAAVDAGGDGFEDVLAGSYEEPYINTAAGAGYMLPVDDDYFYPAWAISATDAARSLLMALGYGQLAMEEETFINFSHSLGLYDDIHADDFTRSEVYKMIYNALHAKVMDQTGFGETPQYEQLKEVNGLYKFHNVVRTRGIITGAGGVSLGSGGNSSLPEGCIELDGVTFNYDGHDMDALLGRDVWLYWFDGGASNPDDVLSIEIIEDNSFTLQAEDIISYSDMTYEYEDNGRLRKIDLDDPYIIHNGEEYLGRYTEDVMIPESGDVTIITGISGVSSDVVIIRSYVDHRVKTIMTEDQIVLSYNGDRLDFGTYETGVQYFTSDGIIAKFSDISSEAVISVAQSASGEKTVVYISKNNVSGKISKCDENIWTIGDAEYQMSARLKFDIEAGNVPAADLSTDYTFYLNFHNEIAFYEEGTAAGSTSNFYAMVTGASLDDGLSNKLTLKVFSKTMGGFGIYPCAEKVKLNGENASINEVFEALKRDGRNGEAGTKFIAQPVKIGLNAANEINMLHQASSYDDGNGFYLHLGSIDTNCSYYGYRNVISISDEAGTEFAAVSTSKTKQVGTGMDTEYIQVPYFNDGRVDVSTEKAFIATHRPSGGFRCFAYKESSDDLTASFIIVITEAGEKVHTESTFNVQMFLSAGKEIVDDAEVTVVKTNKMTYYLDNDNIDLNNLKIYNYDGVATGDTHKVIPGDLLNFSVDSLGYIQAVEIVYSKKDNKMMGVGGFTNYMNDDHIWFTRDGMYNMLLVNLLKADDGYVSGTIVDPASYVSGVDRHYLGVMPSLITLDETRSSVKSRNATGADIIGYYDSTSDWVTLVISHRYAQQNGASYLFKHD